MSLNDAFVKPANGGSLLVVKVQPRASANEICGAQAGELKIRITAPPVDSAANEALVRFLAEKLGCPKSALRLERGEKSRHKILRIAGLDPGEILRRLNE